jgi:hypothetical protein
MTIFVSSQSVDSAPASLLIQGLGRAGVGVEHSPRNPRDGHDPRWQDWYSKGLQDALKRCTSFVAVVDRGWDSSTWMAVEAEEATKRLASTSYYWNPQGVRVIAAGMQLYLTAELPTTLEGAIGMLVQRGGE